MNKPPVHDEPRVQSAISMIDLFDAYYLNRGLQNLVDKARELFGRPLLVHDNSFKVLAASFDIDRAVRTIEDETGARYLDESTIRFIHSRKAVDRVRKKDAAEYIEKPQQDYGTLLSMIKINGIETAHVAVHEAGIPFSEADILLLGEFSKLLSLELQRENPLIANRELIASHLFADLLEGSAIDEETIHRRVHSLRWKMAKPWSLMVMMDRKQETLDSKLPAVIQALKSYIPLHHCLIYAGNIVVFLDPDLLLRLFQVRKTEFDGFLAFNHLCAGISFPFHRLSECRKYYGQGKKAAELAQRENTQALLFENCGLLLLSELIKSKYDMMDFCHPAVSFLIKHDRESGGELLKTLEMYIHFANDPNEAAKTLNIHRNTLFYRMGKIKDLTGITLNTAEEVFKIYFSIRLLKLNGLL